MWEPEPGWVPLPGGMGTSTVGVWRTGDAVVKRLAAPIPGDPVELGDPHHFAYWRRPVDVAASGCVESTAGLRGEPVIRVEEDDDGATLWFPRVDVETPPGPFVARALGRFAGNAAPPYPWLARDQLGDRIRRVERRGGWSLLARTTVADVADRLWTRRGHHLAAVAAMPQVLQHGDPVPANVVGRQGEDAVCVDWGTLGTGPVGADLGYWALSAREDFGVLVEAYTAGLPAGLARADEVVLGAQVSAVYTAMSRADWALARVADGDGALAGKFRHPSVAPYLRSLQRLVGQVEALL